MTISIIVPNYQGKAVFPACVRSLLAQDFRDIQIVFVDDGSTDGSLELCRKLFGKERRVTITSTGVNKGYTGACNHALKSCKGEYIIVLNNDATYPKDWVMEMHRTVEGKRKVIGASIVLHKGDRLDELISSGRYGTMSLTLFGFISRKLTPEERETGMFEVPAAGVLIIPRSAIPDRIFDEDYREYGEDIELCWRLRMRGYHVVVNKRCRMRHLGSYTRRHVPSFNRRAIYNGTKNTIANFLIFLQAKNILRIMPPFLLLNLGLLIARPTQAPYRLKGWWWVLTRLRRVMRKRRQAQRARTISEEENLRLFSYRMIDDAWEQTPARGSMIRAANALLRLYYKAVLVRTFDMQDRHAVPRVHLASIGSRASRGGRKEL